jgi:2-dehydropantoate 2-reductase
MASIAVIGPGAIGATVAAWLAQDPTHEVTVCARSPLERLMIDSPSGPIEASPRILVRPDQVMGPVDWIMIATKAYDSSAAAPWLGQLMGDGSRVAVLQNGIEHRERFAGLVDPARLVPAIVDIPAERTAPGQVTQRRMGTIRVPDDASGAAFVRLFANTPIDVAVTDRFAETAWRKLAINCAGAVNALALRPALIAQDDDIADLMRGLVCECIAVARAEGVDLPDELAGQVVEHYRKADPGSLNSLHADRMAGRPMEWDARNGVIVRRGEAHGLATPLNRMAAALLRVAQEGEKE